MSLNTPDTSREFSEPVKETLSKAQKAVIDRVTLILEADPKLNAEITEKFKSNFLEIVNDQQKFNLLLEKIGSSEMSQLWEIEIKFQKNQIDQTSAIEQSKWVITKYTQMKLTALKWNISQIA